MLQNIRDLLKTTLTYELIFNSSDAIDVMDLMRAYVETCDTREQLITPNGSLAIIWGLDYVYFADDSWYWEMNNTTNSAHFRLHDLVVLDVLLMGIAPAHEDARVREALYRVALTVKNAAMDMTMQLLNI